MKKKARLPTYSTYLHSSNGANTATNPFPLPGVIRIPFSFYLRRSRQVIELLELFFFFLLLLLLLLLLLEQFDVSVKTVNLFPPPIMFFSLIFHPKFSLGWDPLHPDQISFGVGFNLSREGTQFPIDLFLPQVLEQSLFLFFLLPARVGKVSEAHSFPTGVLYNAHGNNT